MKYINRYIKCKNNGFANCEKSSPRDRYCEHDRGDFKIGDLVIPTFNGEQGFWIIDKYDDQGSFLFRIKSVNDDRTLWISFPDMVKKVNSNLKAFI